MYLPHPPKGEPLRQARCSGSLAYDGTNRDNEDHEW